MGSFERKIGKLLVSDKEIGKGSNGKIVLEGVYDACRVAVKRIVKVYHEVASKEIQNLIESDEHTNIVRWHGVEYDQDFVYIALEHCIYSLHELILPQTSSSTQVQSSIEVFKDFKLWKPNGYPSPELLRVMRDAASGLAHLQELGIIHRDLNPQTVLIHKGRKVVDDVIEDEDFKGGSWVSAVEFVNSNGEGIVNGCLEDIENYLKNEKLEQVVAITKSCTPNTLGDLIMTLKDLSVQYPGTNTLLVTLLVDTQPHFAVCPSSQGQPHLPIYSAAGNQNKVLYCCQVNISSGKILWSILIGPPIYDAHQSPNLEDDEHNSSRQQNNFYIDCGDDWQLYIYDKNSKAEKEIPKDFLVETPFEEDKRATSGKTDTKSKSIKLNNAWKLYTDRALSFDVSRAGLILINPGGKEYTYALRFKFKTTNNKAKYEALLAGLWIAQEMEIRSLAIFADSQLMNKKANALRKLASMNFKHLTKEVLVEVLAKRSTDDSKVLKVKVKEGENWMTPIHEYLFSGLVPEDPKESKKIIIKAPQYNLIKGSLYKKSFFSSWIHCVTHPQVDNIINEIHEGSCGFNAKPHLMVVKITKQGYYWPLMYRDSA
ncbi:reverse transcriptase domain-containing protein [Tanacetum coccineum]|uniref:Reverse transcriptase domain-containing protein n=1 Tax=Tanacetum coccineum TaxID=301880 RepID=A0ABQ5GB78_9ASTR